MNPANAGDFENDGSNRPISKVIGVARARVDLSRVLDDLNEPGKFLIYSEVIPFFETQAFVLRCDT